MSSSSRVGWEPFRTILLIVLVLLLLGVLPTWGHSRSWGYGPTGGLGLILVIVLFARDGVMGGLRRIGAWVAKKKNQGRQNKTESARSTI